MQGNALQLIDFAGNARPAPLADIVHGSFGFMEFKEVDSLSIIICSHNGEQALQSVPVVFFSSQGVNAMRQGFFQRQA